MQKLLPALVLAILLSSPVSAAIIEGKVYSWETFEPLKNCIVTINTTPVQRYVAVNGSYMFEVEPGVYLLEAYYYGDITLYANETVRITENGTYRIDLLAQPVIEELNASAPEISFELGNGKRESSWPVVPVFIALTVVIAASGYLIIRRKSEKRDDEEELPEDLEELLAIIRRSGGRITQKELKQLTGYSDAKISLMLTDLERRGKIERVKKGRGKIIFLKE
ncbi:helix-turn-helix transcriptional regulator [Geoglobus ahangari]